jgi:tetratricopeptide (TPR) repeat protein
VIIAASSEDGNAYVFDAISKATLLVLKGHSNVVLDVTISPDGQRLATVARDNTARIWDLRNGTPLLELKGHADNVINAAFSPDGNWLATASEDNAIRLWDGRPNRNILVADPASLSPGDYTADGKYFIHQEAERAVLVPVTWDPDEMAEHLFDTRPRPERHLQAFEAAHHAGDFFAAAVHLDRLLAYSSAQRGEWLEQRNKLQQKIQQMSAFSRAAEQQRKVLTARDRSARSILVEARTEMHTPALKAPAIDWDIVAALAANGDRLATRLVGQKRLADGKPGEALVLLHLSMLGRKGDRSPPLEELVIAQCLLELKKPEEAMRYYRAAADWFDRQLVPYRAANAATHGFNGGWQVVAELNKPIDDPRYNSFDWESWYEAEIFRKALETKIKP